jgi:biopolymer transport protein ExbD
MSKQPSDEFPEDAEDGQSNSDGNHNSSHDSAHEIAHRAEAKFTPLIHEVDADEELEEEPFGTKKEPIPEDELDMTPMVDVTFLLLIFFMVTASFSLQKSIEQPPAKSDMPSINNDPDELEIEPDYVEVVIDQNDTYYVTSRDAEEVEAPSETEMRSRVKDAKEMSNATRLIIKAHVDSKHRRLVTAWDAGINVGMDKIEVQTFDEDY